MKVIILFVAILSIFNVNAVTLFIGSAFPDGSPWTASIKMISKEVKVATKGEVVIKVFTTNAADGESAIFKKIETEQIHGGLFTGKKLGEIYNDIKILDIPFSFIEYKKDPWTAIDIMSSFFNRGLKRSGFVNLGLFNFGQVYFVTKDKVESVNQMKGLKVWTAGGGKMARSIVKNFGATGVNLQATSVFSALSTGSIEMASAPPLIIESFRWNMRSRFIYNPPFVNAVGALLVSDKFWKQISPANQSKIMSISSRNIKQTNQAVVNMNNNAITRMKKTGLKLITFSQNDIRKFKTIRLKIIKELAGKEFSMKAVKKLDSLLSN